MTRTIRHAVAFLSATDVVAPAIFGVEHVDFELPIPRIVERADDGPAVAGPLMGDLVHPQTFLPF